MAAKEGTHVMPTLIKMTQDGRKVEVIGSMVCLDGKPESWEVVDLINHPRKWQILMAMQEATHVAGRIPLTAQEAELAKKALWDNQAAAAANPSAVAARLQAAMNRRAWSEGIE
jgi:hypothetical protein